MDHALSPPLAPPWMELRGIRELGRLPARWNGLVSEAPPGDGSLVVVLPGFRTDDSITHAIVAWQACLDRHDRVAEHAEVDATHFGLGFSPDVYAVVAERLGRR